MEGPRILERAVQVILFIFAAFGGYLANIAPPEETGEQFAVGAGCVVSLMVLLYVSAISHRSPQRKYKRKWLFVAGVSLASALLLGTLYFGSRQKYTFGYPDESSAQRYVAGGELTEDARQYVAKNPGIPVSRLVSEYGGLEARSLVWTTESIQRSTRVLTATYLALIIAFATTIFSLTEGILLRGSRST